MDVSFSKRLRRMAGRADAVGRREKKRCGSAVIVLPFAPGARGAREVGSARRDAEILSEREVAGRRAVPLLSPRAANCRGNVISPGQPGGPATPCNDKNTKFGNAQRPKHGENGHVRPFLTDSVRGRPRESGLHLLQTEKKRVFACPCAALYLILSVTERIHSEQRRI